MRARLPRPCTPDAVGHCIAPPGRPKVPIARPGGKLWPASKLPPPRARPSPTETPMTDDTPATPFRDAQALLEAKFAPEADTLMPQSFADPIAEARACLDRAAIFDLSNVGRLRLRGDQALDLLEHVCTADVVRQEDDTARYTLLCNDSGGTIAQAFVVRLENHWLMTVDPINRTKVADYLASFASRFSFRLDDQTPKTAHALLAGPGAATVLDKLLPGSADLSTGQALTGSMLLAKYVVLRVASTGTWGAEVVLPKMFANRAWTYITTKAEDHALAPAGTVAHDMLRVRAGLCRYGHELNETIDPISAGLAHAVAFDHEFVGRDALEKLARTGPPRRRVLLAIEDASGDRPGLPRQGDELRKQGRSVGTVTSGTFDPVRNLPIAQAYLPAAQAEAGAELTLTAADNTQRTAHVLAVPGTPTQGPS